MEPLISVIVPIYKVETYLRRCVDSLLVQTYKKMEIILVDDGSPDGCPAICDDYAKQDERIQFIHQKNAGLSGARNAGIDAANGAYFAFVDSDDYVAPDFIRTLYELLTKTGSAISQCRFGYVEGEPLQMADVADCSVKICRGMSLMEQLYGPEDEAVYFVVAWNKLYKRELFEKIRYPEGRIHEDEATTYKLFHEGKKLAFTDRVLYGYFTENAGSITSNFSRKRLQWLTAQEERIGFFQEYGYEAILPRAYKKLCDACITFYFRCTKGVEDASALRRELKQRLKVYKAEGARYIKALPLRTRAGYGIFLLAPGFYAKLLEKVQDQP